MIQIDMEMPGSCNECPFRDYTYKNCVLMPSIPAWQKPIEDGLHCMNRSKHCPLKDEEIIRQKMWDALYQAEDEIEDRYSGTEENDAWFMVYRPYLQRGFEIGLRAMIQATEGEE